MEQGATGSIEDQQNLHLQLLVGTGLDAGIPQGYQSNEDSVFAIQGTQTYKGRLQPFGVFIVADGIGDHEYGAEASNLALRVMSNSIVPFLLGNAALGQDALFELLISGVQRANEVLYRYNVQEHTHIGTTVTSVLISGSTAYVVNVGNSRTYLFREPNTLSQVTRIHSVITPFEGGITPSSHLNRHSQRRQLEHYLGEKATVQVDTFTLSLKKGDKLLLCSDGLWEMVRDPDLEQIMRVPVNVPAQVVEMLIQAALKEGGRDNISVIVAFLS